MSDISLEIHHLDVRGGDATAIIVKEHIGNAVKDLCRVLIDAGAEKHGSNALQLYLSRYLPGAFDLVVATHYHEDHILGFSEANIVFKHFVDLGGYSSRDKQFTPRNGVGSGADKTKPFRSYAARTHTTMDDPDDSSVKINPQRVPINFIRDDFDPKKEEPQPKLFELGHGIELICYCANGILADEHNTNVLAVKKKRKRINPNDVSIAMILEWGDFRYLTAGDLSGDSKLTKYYDIEGPLVKYLSEGPLKDKKITVLKASHHGSEHSTQTDLLDKLKPETIIVCCNQRKKVPSAAFLERLLKDHLKKHPGSRVVFTNTLRTPTVDPRYSPLENMEKLEFITPNNIKFDSAGANAVASNLNVKCAVIRRRVSVENGHTTVIPQGQPDRALCQPDVRPGGYDIVLMKRDDDEARLVTKITQYTDYVWDTSWEQSLCSDVVIFKQFREQAQAMVRWLELDTERRDPVGQRYIREWYPALLAVVESSARDKSLEALVTNMEEMFKATVTLNQTKSGLMYKPKLPPPTPNVMKTISFLMKGNFHQQQFNESLGQRKITLQPLGEWAWNKPNGPGQEPYWGGGGQKQERELDNELEERPRKRQRTSQ